MKLPKTSRLNVTEEPEYLWYLLSHINFLLSHNYLKGNNPHGKNQLTAFQG